MNKKALSYTIELLGFVLLILPPFQTYRMISWEVIPNHYLLYVSTAIMMIIGIVLLFLSRKMRK
ncbi:hypothetical protein ACFLQN_00330 [Candidatus Aenigmatarchaeota archaeon]